MRSEASSVDWHSLSAPPLREGWLRQRLESKPGKTIQFGSLGKKSLDDISTFWKALRRGTSKEIAHAARTFTDCGEDEEKESLAFTGLSTPLVLLGRGAVIRALHADLPARLGETFAVGAAVELGDSGDWDNALAILERAHQDGGSPYVHMSTESHLWKHAYLQGHVDTVLPRLAVIPFNRKVPHAGGGTGLATSYLSGPLRTKRRARTCAGAARANAGL